jgi:hypothetical protein
MMGGSVPTDSLVEILEAPFVIMPLVNGDTVVLSSRLLHVGD